MFVNIGVNLKKRQNRCNLLRGEYMLIGFSGPSCSGKTTVIQKVYEQLRNQGIRVAMINEVARWVFDRYFSGYGTLDRLRRDKWALMQFQRKVYEEQIYLEQVLCQQYDLVLTDRTLFDVLMYVVTYCDVRHIAMFAQSCMAVGDEWYDKVFLFEPLEGVNCEDGFRSATDIGTRRVHFEMLKNWFGHWDRVVVVPADMSVEERVQLVIEQIWEV